MPQSIAAQSGYTLPVFACASAIAAVETLLTGNCPDVVALELLEPAITAEITIEQGALLGQHRALAISRSEPGNNLDLTRHTPVWAEVEFTPGEGKLIIQGGEGIGKQLDREGQAAIYSYAQRLLHHHLQPRINEDQNLAVTLILPLGRTLATRTSNAAFGVVEGLSLLGTSGIAQPLSAPDQLAEFQRHLTSLAQQHQCLVFCLGENGLDLARQWGVPLDQMVKTANWLGSLLVSAAAVGVQEILLLGYHGKLIKLAGGIFHTHHHLADGRLEILTAQAVQGSLPYPLVQELGQAPTTEAGLKLLRQWQTEQNYPWVSKIYQAMAGTIDRRSEEYVYKVSQHRLKVGSLLFDGDRLPVVISAQGQAMADKLGLTMPETYRPA
ncbi:cobalt-precorrin-5B (C(1))-methyltransferase CbiD [Synechocystis sp. PCC 7338]|uniref:cobalt-precorrin-5B (C(1))-methyltransferase CbiD n=1 Tax=Synechocystis sp. PCC 7338 TaxID=2732530 RepID=UPI001BAE86FC|nr:cobalt-precorrin-5B (C(1))-methyltransferase CbiD [Synechocystis sp. PCC 7338]QUS61069.1 cobalamin biosynthesis protein CbiD [Synechocystis sp. PCC 7338]